MTYKQVFRNALKRDLLNTDECERWFVYRDVRNATAHLYGSDYADEALKTVARKAH